MLLSSCSSLPPSRRDLSFPVESPTPPRYSLVFIIHGDGSYLYHDTRGVAHRADQEALGGARRVAAMNPQAEVFVFHQRPRRRALLFFPRPDGRLYYYRQGRLLAEEPYWRGPGRSPLGPEAELYHRYRAGAQLRPVSIFLYFGHEIPEFGGLGYDASYSDRALTVNDLASGLKRIARDSAKIDLVVLSTCFNGTPHTVSALSPYARTIIASPGNLHLSYLDLRAFERLDDGLGDGDVPAFAARCAQRAFERLAEELQTGVTVSVYDVDRVREYVGSVDSAYNQALTALAGQGPGVREHGDCADNPAYALPGMSRGVDVFYRPPRFGRLKHKQGHSGWGCWIVPGQIVAH